MSSKLKARNIFVVFYSLDCTILIQNDASISRKHSVLTVQHDEANLVIT